MQVGGPGRLSHRRSEDRDAECVASSRKRHARTELSRAQHAIEHFVGILWSQEPIRRLSPAPKVHGGLPRGCVGGILAAHAEIDMAGSFPEVEALAVWEPSFELDWKGNRR